MAADFNAGSIEGTLDLDTDPFEVGLVKAKQQAKDFAEETYTATVKTQYETEGDAPDPKATKDSTTSSTTKITADDSGLKRKVAEDEALLEALDKKKVKPEIDADTDASVSAIERLSKTIDRATGVYKKAGPKAPGSGHGLMLLAGLAASLAPALAPAIPAIGLFAAAAVAGFGGAAVSLALYAKVFVGALGSLQQAIKDGKQLPGIAGQAETALKGLSGAWSDLKSKAEPGIFALMIPVFNTLSNLVPKLLPLINAMSTGLMGAFKPIAHVLDGGQFQRFIDLLGANAIKDLPKIGHILANGLSGLMALFTALNPLIQVGLTWVVKISKEFENWSKFQAPGAITGVMDMLAKQGPPLVKMLGDVLSALSSIASGLGPLIGPATVFLDGMAKALDLIDLSTLATGVGDVLVALTPFLGVIAALVNVLLPPLGVLLSTLADAFIGPLGESLTTTLVPAFQALADVLDYAAPYLGKIIASFADLVNPTGVGLLAGLIEGLAPIFKDMIPPVSNLVIALESMVDTFLTAVGPTVIPALTAVLGGLVTALTPVVDGLAWFLSHKSVAITILGIATAVKAAMIATKLWSAATVAFAAITGVLEAVSFGYVGLTAAELAASTTAKAGTAAFVAQQIALKIGAAAAKGMAAAQWLLNVAMDAFPVMLIVIAIAALAAGLIYAYTHSEKFRAAVDKIGDAFQWLWKKAQPVLDFFKTHWLELVTLFVAPILLIPLELYKHWGAISDFFGSIKGWIFEKVGDAVGWLKDTGSAIIDGLWGGIQTAWGAVSGFFVSVYGKISGWFSGAKDWLTDKGSAVINGLWGGIKTAWNNEKAGWEKIGSTIKGWFNGAKDWLTDKGSNIIQGLWGGIKTVWTNVSGWFGDLSGKARSAIGDAGNFLIDKGSAMIRGLWDGIKTKWGEVMTWFGEIGSKAVTGVGNLGVTLYNAGVALLTGFKNGITDTIGKAVQAVKDGIALIAGLMPGSPAKWGPLSGKGYTRIRGQALMAGFALGIKDTAGSAVDAAQAAIDAVSGALQATLPTLSINGGAAAAQATALGTLSDGLGTMISDLIATLQQEGTDSRTMTDDQRAALVAALEGQTAALIKSNQTTSTNVITSIRKG